MSRQFLFILIGLCGTVAIWLLHRLGLYAERKGWLYYKEREPTGGGNGIVRGMLELERFLAPSAEHRTEVQETTVKTVRPHVPGNDEGLSPIFTTHPAVKFFNDNDSGQTDA